MSLSKKLVELSVFLHTELSSMSLDESTLELSDILNFDPSEALDYIRETATDLLSAKRNFMMMDEYKDFESSQQYQRALQKLEGEVRNHIKVQQQMKLLLDMTQGKQEESDRKYKQTIDKLKSENGSLTKQIEEIKKDYKLRITELEQSLTKSKASLFEREKEISLFKNKYSKLRSSQKENIPEPELQKKKPEERKKTDRRRTPLSSRDKPEATPYTRSQKKVRSLKRPLSSQAAPALSSTHRK